MTVCIDGGFVRAVHKEDLFEGALAFSGRRARRVDILLESRLFVIE